VRIEVVVMRLFGDRLYARVSNARVGEQQRDRQMPQGLQFVHVGAGHLEPGDDQHMIGQAEAVKRAQVPEQVWFDAGQKRVGSLIQELERRDVRPERVMAGEHADGLIIIAQQVWCIDLEVPPELADTVPAIQWAADDVIQAQAAFAIADDQRHIRVQGSLLIGGHQRQRARAGADGHNGHKRPPGSGGMSSVVAPGPNHIARSRATTPAWSEV
jgi:hypothetical protein